MNTRYGFLLLFFSFLPAPAAAGDGQLGDIPESLDALIVVDEQSAQPLPIGTIFAAPEAYQLHSVMMQGTAREVRKIGPPSAGCGTVPDTSRFILDDGTGAIEVLVVGACATPELRIPVTEGKQLLVQAVVQVNGTEQQLVQAVARGLRQSGR